MSLASVLITIGLVIGFGAFGFATINMLHETTSEDPFSEFDDLFKKHVGAMIVIAFGGLLFVVGLILAGVNILNSVIQ